MRKRRLRILLVDDDADDHLMFNQMIAEIPGNQWTVDWMSSSDEGREAILKGEHDICFLDYRLGKETGLDLLREAIARGIHLPIVLLTGYGEEEVDLEAMRSGAADYLVKDQVNSTTLERCIRYAIHRSETLAALREREAQVLMQDRLASVGLLASSLAHEIGTPLGVIRGRAEYLALQLQSDEAMRKNADVIIAQIDRVSALIRSLLNLARGDGTRGTTEIELKAVLNEVLDLMGHELRKHQIALSLEVPDDVKIQGESSALHQVLLNVLVNAVHAIESAARDQGRTVDHRIRIQARRAEAQWVIEISDTGCGISEANKRNLFKPFFTTKDIGIGTGLGLVTSYRIVESWGGTIQVESTEGVGTTLRLLLPIA